MSLATPARARSPKSTRGSGDGFAARTVLFNDDVHTFDEVARQLVKATRCTYEKGMALAGQVHAKGSAVVYSGALERCEAVAAVLEEIRLRAVVER